MRYAILADIHSNLPAFQAVLHDIEERGGFNQLWCLGDVVGYGPEPHECLELLRGFDHLCIAGNHDWAVADKIDTGDFNHDAATANRWTSAKLTASDKSYLQTLPCVLVEDIFTLVHGSPRDPLWEYMISPITAQESTAFYDTPFCFVGHSHVPIVFEFINDVAVKRVFIDNETLCLGTNKLIINPGSVGQPRDGDPRASYILYDSDANTVCLRRVSYDIEITQRRMEFEGLPAFLISRLTYGQ
jgi:diadenosine tetraphosphatase ApaH/serine/threonine PP2A family protein phosphatase